MSPCAGTIASGVSAKRSRCADCCERAMCSAILRRSASCTESCAAGWGAALRARNEDHVGAGRELLELHRRTGDDQFLEAARKLAALNASFPAGPNGERYHRGDTPGWRWQIWVDCMDVDGPFLAALAHATGEDRYFDQAVGELLGYARTLQADSGLLFHGFERDCGRNGELWARGNGWALMGLVDTLVLLPRSHPAWPELQQRTVALVDALALAQHPSGLWHTVVNDPATYLESTLATMAAYALREGMKHGVLDIAPRGDGTQGARCDAFAGGAGWHAPTRQRRDARRCARRLRDASVRHVSLGPGAAAARAVPGGRMKIVKVEAFPIQAEPIDTRAYWGSRAWGTERAAAPGRAVDRVSRAAAPPLHLFADDRHRHRAHRNRHADRSAGARPRRRSRRRRRRRSSSSCSPTS